MDAMIQVEHLFKTYKKSVAVSDLSFSVQAGVCFGFLGPNGAGKTTTMKILYNKARRDRHALSRVLVMGLDPEASELAIKSRLGVVAQENNLDSELNVRENLMIYARLHNMKRSRAEERVAELLAFMELTEKAAARTDSLSGGMKRRLVIARALMNKPDLLILDEPSTGLDPQVRHLIWEKLRQLKEQGVTILLTTHYMEEAFALCDEILIMDKGKNMLIGNPSALLHQHLEPYVLEMADVETMSMPELLPVGVRKESHGGKNFYYSFKI